METVHVIGAGGIGCAVGYAVPAGSAVVFVDANPEKVESGRRDGVRVDALPALAAEFVHFDDWSPPPAATVILCVKCYDNAAVLARLPADIQLIPIQNGFDPQLAARDLAAEGIASFVSECDPQRPHTRITRRGKLHWGGVASPPMAMGGLFRIQGVPDIAPIKYAKLMYNAAISPLAAAAGLDNGQLLSVPTARRLFFAHASGELPHLDRGRD